ncbi:ABC transporter substrate-binding protein [Granulicoccus phenolivorans]|uniref:ABC transporter substrate-binding protein n=1 Tax=Granulicoccus phenolivorans TaxID=266854 RepID=UPI000403DCD7|nr:ABC transporter substrate-binding protein [Granulicoccus phenolivorans]
MKKAWKIIASAAVTVGLLTGCGGGSGTAASGDTIKIGVNYELSGDVATYGQANVEGIEMATEEINNAGGIKGKKIELVKYDNKSTASEATTLATKLMTQDKVIAQIGPATSGAFKATIPVADKSKVPVVTGSATADDVTVDAQGKVQQYAFRTCFSDSYQGTAMAKYAREKKNAQSAVILTDNSSDYSKGLTASFEKTFTEAGGKVVSKQSYNKGDTDFNAILTAIRGQQFDMIYLPGYYSEAGLIIKQARAQGITQPIVGADGFDSPKLAELAGKDALTNVFFSNHYSSLSTDPAVQKFITDFKAKYNKEPDAFNALGYDTLKFVANGLQGGATTGADLEKALAATKDFQGVTGTISVDANHNAVKSVTVIEMRNGVQAAAEKFDA